MRCRRIAAFLALGGLVAAGEAGADPGGVALGMEGDALPVPVFHPAAIPPSELATAVAVGVKLPRCAPCPEHLTIEELTTDGVVRVGELRDDGGAGDAVPNDRFYVGRARLGSPVELERSLRLRAGEGPGAVVSREVVFPVSRIPLGLGTSDPERLLVDPGSGIRFFADEVTLAAVPGTSPRRVRTLAAELGERLGLAGIRVDGFLPRLGAYSIRLAAPVSVEAHRRVRAAFEAEPEIESASPNYLGRPAAQPHLDDIRVPQMWSEQSGGLMPSDPAFPAELLGKSQIGVAVTDTSLDCGGDLTGRCVPKPATTGSCDNYLTANQTPGHGTWVMQFLAGASGTPAGFGDIEEGVAANTRIFPFDVSPGSDAMTASISCAATDLSVATGADVARIVNISREYSNLPDTPPEMRRTAMRNAVCEAVCADMLLVVAAGNQACTSGDAISAWPALFDDAETCACPDGSSRPVDDQMLTVGGTDETGARGDSCGTDNQKSKLGEVYARGWNPDLPSVSNGTSFAAPQVAGCAAVLGAAYYGVAEDGGGAAAGAASWDARKVAARIAHSKARDSTGGTTDSPLLDCAEMFAPDVAFVLDRSGSMGGASGDVLGVTRWEALTEASVNFAQMLTATESNARFGLTLFASDVVTDGFDGLGWVVNDPPDPSSPPLPALETTLRSELVDDHSPGGSTAMGRGLLHAIGELDDRYGQPRVVVLFSDGEQNTGPQVSEVDGCNLSDGSKLYDACPNPQPDGEVKVVTVGIGQVSSTYFAVLQQIATANRGVFLSTSNGATYPDGAMMISYTDAFTQAVAPVLAGASPLVATAHSGSLISSATFPPFRVNEGTQRLVLSLSVPSDSPEKRLRTLLSGLRITRDGQDVTQHFAPRGLGDSWSMLLTAELGSAGLPLDGEYQIAYAAQSRAPALVYRIVAFADDPQLDMEWRVEPSAPRAERPFSPTLALSWRGEPITDAVVRARILKPGDDLGDALAGHPTTVDPSNAPDAGSPGTRKYFDVMANDSKFAERLRPGEQGLLLVHRGEGVYSAEFRPGDVSGVYQVLYEIRASDPAFGTIQRQALQSVYVRFADVDWDASLLSDPAVTAAGVTIETKPITRYGRLIGPGQGNAFAVVGENVALSEIEDHQDGRYTLRVETEQPETPVQILLLDEVVYEGPLVDRFCGGKVPWLWIAIAVVVLVLVGAIGLRRRS